jgi:hypothetical protein
MIGWCHRRGPLPDSDGSASSCLPSFEIARRDIADTAQFPFPVNFRIISAHVITARLATSPRLFQKKSSRDRLVPQARTAFRPRLR